MVPLVSIHMLFTNTWVLKNGKLSVLVKRGLHLNLEKTGKVNLVLEITVFIPFDRFHYMAVADDRRRYMPLPEDRLAGRAQPLAFQEAVSLVNPVVPQFRGEVT